MRAHTTAAGLLVAAALVFPVLDVTAGAQGKQKPNPQDMFNDIPEPSTVRDRNAPVPEFEPADVGDVPDPVDVDEDPTPEPTPEPIPVVNPQPTPVVTTEPTPSPVSSVVEPDSQQPSPEVTTSPSPEPPVAVVPEATAAVPAVAPEGPEPAGTAAPKIVAVQDDDPGAEPSPRPQPERRSAARGSSAESAPQRVVAVRTRTATRRVRQTYRIQPGDTLSSIAARYGLSWQRLAVSNGLRDPNLIYAGDTLALY